MTPAEYGRISGPSLPQRDFMLTKLPQEISKPVQVRVKWSTLKQTEKSLEITPHNTFQQHSMETVEVRLLLTLPQGEERKRRMKHAQHSDFWGTMESTHLPLL